MPGVSNWVIWMVSNRTVAADNARSLRNRPF
jgi:hypothetical protein